MGLDCGQNVSDWLSEVFDKPGLKLIRMSPEYQRKPSKRIWNHIQDIFISPCSSTVAKQCCPSNIERQAPKQLDYICFQVHYTCTHLHKYMLADLISYRNLQDHYIEKLNRLKPIVVLLVERVRIGTRTLRLQPPFKSIPKTNKFDMKKSGM